MGSKKRDGSVEAPWLLPNGWVDLDDLVNKPGAYEYWTVEVFDGKGWQSDETCRSITAARRAKKEAIEEHWRQEEYDQTREYNRKHNIVNVHRASDSVYFGINSKTTLSDIDKWAADLKKRVEGARNPKSVPPFVFDKSKAEEPKVRVSRVVVHIGKEEVE